MPYVSATFVADLPTISAYQTAGINYAENFWSPLYGLLPLYTVFFLPLETNYPSLAYTSSLKIPPYPQSISPFSRMPWPLAHYQT